MTGGKDDDGDVFEPKMTRSKMKEFLEKRNNVKVWPLSPVKLGPSILDVEFNEDEDEEDDEYQPSKDAAELESDDESVVSSNVSDIGSPFPLGFPLPKTPSWLVTLAPTTPTTPSRIPTVAGPQASTPGRSSNNEATRADVYDMASAMSSSSLRAPGVRKVTFAPSATVYLFDRQVMLDRWPRDGETFGLGMQANHFLTEEHPLEDPEVHPRGKLRPVEFQDRLHLLQSYLSSMTARLCSALHGEVGEWKKLFHSMKQSGCSCRGACDPSTCECLLAGVYDMASAMSSSSLRAPGVRKVTFAPSATVYLFDRQVMLDRWPRDGETFGLGMQAYHFLTEEHPLEDPEVHPRGKLRPVELQDRLHLLQSYLSSMTARLRSALQGEVGEWKKLFHSMKQSGCSCRGACDPSTCECLLAGGFDVAKNHTPSLNSATTRTFLQNHPRSVPTTSLW
ncbi:hypothetical protein ACOMHN_048705 [Nucella lapillus]